MRPPVTPPHSVALRRGRVSEPGRPYHLRTSTDGNRPLFTDLRLGRQVVLTMRHLHELGDVESLAFVVMPTHLHWLMILQDRRRLDQVMQSLKGFSAHQINQWRGREGPVWQPGYFDHALRRDEDLRAVARYIVGNPLRAGLVTSLADYPLWDAVWVGSGQELA